MEWFLVIVFILSGIGLGKLGKAIQKDAHPGDPSTEPDLAQGFAGGCLVLVGWILLVLGIGGIFWVGN